jgi:hypothetical protein
MASYIVFKVIAIVVLITYTETAEVGSEDPNINHCGYLTPSQPSDCYSKNTTKSQCCAIGMNNTKFACMPQSSSFFVNHGAKFNIDGTPSTITCGTLGEKDTGRFFGYNYCGMGANATKETDCRPVGLETTCCFLKSFANTTYQGTKNLHTCLVADWTFQTSVVAQTLFPATDTFLRCYNSTNLNTYIHYNVTSMNNAVFIKISILGFLVMLLNII